MIKPQSEEIQKFLDGIMLMDGEKYKWLVELREIIFNAHPGTKEKMMYGGIVFYLNDKMYSGIFASKNHATIEFSIGYLMKDPNKHLEGSGKYRRHLKIRNDEDIINKEVPYFIKQAI